MSVGNDTLLARAVIINLTRKREGGIKGGEIIDMDGLERQFLREYFLF